MDPSRWQFQPLSSSDKIRVRSLKQVHILARHGTRILPVPIRSIFPNSTQKWECHWKTVNTRYYKNIEDWMSFKLKYVNNEQIVEGSCAQSSSLKQVIAQHRANAQMAKAFYIGEENYQLMSLSQLDDIAGELTYYNQLSDNVNIPDIKIIAADFERTITSATVFMSEFLNINTPDVAMELYTHDYQSDPYTTYKDKHCPKINDYIQDLGMNSTQYKKLMRSQLMNRTQHEWYQATKQNYSYDNGEGAVLMYCGGLDLDLKWEHFLNVLNMSYRIREAILANNETSTKACKLAASPLAWLFKTLIRNHILYLRDIETAEIVDGAAEDYLNAQKAKLIYHSVHDLTILLLLQAMGISNGREPMFAEMLTLEIYERSRNDPWYNKNVEEVTDELYTNYLFRWTRKGKPLAMFPGCEAEYKYTQSSLCSLSVLMSAIEYGQNIKTWEQTCSEVTEEYFNQSKYRKKKKHKHVSNMMESSSRSSLMYGWTFLFGVSIGMALVIFGNKYNRWFMVDKWKYESIS